MKQLFTLFLLLVIGSAAYAQTPTFNSVTLNGPGNITASGLISGGALSVTGASALNGGGTLGGTFGGPTVLSNFDGTLTSISSPPGSASSGFVFYYPGCANGNQGVAPGTSPTGCPAFFDNNGTLRTMPNPPSQTITIGGQSIYLGGSTTNQGTGTVLLTCSGSFVNGNAIITNASGTCVDGGAAPGGGGGGSGTVGTCANANSLAYYASTGTSITCLSKTNSSLVSRNSGGTLAEVTTTPSGLTIPSATISNPSITGTATVAVETLTGKLTTAASATIGANFNCAQGTAPTTPGNGDMWCTASGMSGRFNGATTGPFIGLANLSGTLPIAYNSGTGAISCPTCATTTNGGALSGTAPVAISAGGAISLGEVTVPVAILLWNATTTVTNDSYLFYWGHATGHITGVKYYTAGTSTPSFTVGLQVNGINVTGCNAVSVTASNTQASPGSTTCTSTAITSGQSVSVSTTAIAGAPAAALVEVIGTASPS